MEEDNGRERLILTDTLKEFWLAEEHDRRPYDLDIKDEREEEVVKEVSSLSFVKDSRILADH